MIRDVDKDFISVKKSLSIVTAMADALEYYLIEGEIYRTVVTPVEHGYERFTMSAGELLALLHKLDAQRSELLQDQRRLVDELKDKVQRVTQRLWGRYHQLLEREIISRLDSLNWFLNDCQNDMAKCRDHYPSEIRNRERIEELLQAWGEKVPLSVSDRVERIDQRIRQLTEAAPFIWSKEEEKRFPQDPYWYLHVLPKAAN